jgi:cytochrome c-type biogenesis protein CcmF
VTSPIAALGTVTLIIAFLVIAYAGAAGIIGQRTQRPGLVQSSLQATWAWTALMTLASCLMIYAFLAHDFRIKYVAHYSDTTMPLFYLVTAYWGGLDGSLMFWVWVLSVFTAVALYVNRDRHRDMLGYVIGTVAAVSIFFLALLLYSKNPFATFLSNAPVEGRGLNPLLQNYWMVIHPPSLYIGYVGMTIPFAFCIGALASGRLDDSWLHSIRVWVLIPWFFLGLGLILGGLWAYEELGWGGYWAWDPVENAGLIPWFTATAFLHSVMIQERRGMLKVWNVVLMITTFFLTVFGTFMTRSGVVQSVHAFGQDNELALLFLIFMSVTLVVSFGLVLYRLPALRAANSYESFLSREFAFLLNNILFLACAFFVLFATMFPTLSEYIMEDRINIGPVFFNRFMVPIALVLLFLTGAGPLLAWRDTSSRRILDQFAFPLSLGVLTVVALAIFWPPSRELQEVFTGKLHLPMALVCFGVVAFTFGSIAQEFYRGARVRRKQTGSDWLTALVGITLAKRRKYGGYIVHLGLAVMFFGFIGKAYSREKTVTVAGPGQAWEMDGYTFTYDDLQIVENENRVMFTATVSVKRGDDVITVAHPARWSYKTGNQETTTEVFIDRGMGKDIYVVLNGFDERSRQANFIVYLNPLVNFVWLGFGILCAGVAVCLLPLARRGAGAAAAGILVLVLGAGDARAQEQPGRAMEAPKHEIVHGVVTEGENAPPVAKRLWADLVCLCGGCKRETFQACKCAYAKKERDKVLEMLAGKDLSSPEKEQAAYDEVIAAYRDRFGGDHVLNVPPDTAFNRLAWVVPYAAFGAAVIFVAVLARSWVRRGRRARFAAAPPPAGTERTAYDDKLDDELDRME